MAKQTGITSIDQLRTEADKMRARIEAIGQELARTESADQVATLAAEQHALSVSLAGIEARIDAARQEQAKAQAERRERERLAQLSEATEELQHALADYRRKAEALDAAADVFSQAAHEYMRLGGSIHGLQFTSPDLARTTKAQLKNWAKFDRIPEEAKEREAQARKARLAELERVERLWEEQEKEAARLKERYPWAEIQEQG